MNFSLSARENIQIYLDSILNRKINRRTNMNKKYMGSDFDDFLVENRILFESEMISIKRIVAYLMVRLTKEQV